MKKRNTLFTMGVCLILSVTGCGANKGPNEVTKDLDYIVSDYVTLGNYKGVEVLADPNVVTDAELDEAIQADLEAHGTPKQLKEGTVAEGDTVNIDYEGQKDGVAFENGTGKGYDLTIGSGAFIPGFEEKLIGAKVGKTVNLDLTFPEDFGSEELNGQAVVFIVKVNYIAGEPIIPELNEEYVTKNTKYKTIDEYKEGKKAEILLNKSGEVWTSVVSSAEISKYPEKEVDSQLADIKDYYESYAKSMGMEYADFLSQLQLTEDTFESTMKPYAEQAVGEKLVFYAVVEAEDMTLSDDEFAKGKKQLMEDFEYDDEETFVKDYGEKSLKSELLLRKVKEFIAKEAKVVDKLTETPKASEETLETEAAPETETAPAE